MALAAMGGVGLVLGESVECDGGWRTLSKTSAWVRVQGYLARNGCGRQGQFHLRHQ
jgi:hypothetical protein